MEIVIEEEMKGLAIEENTETKKTVYFTVGKIDAGMSILLTEEHHVIELPALLLPESATVGSIVKVMLERDEAQEKTVVKEFLETQERILDEFTKLPKTPSISINHLSYTSVVLKYEQLELFNCKLKKIEIANGEGKKLDCLTNPPPLLLNVGTGSNQFLNTSVNKIMTKPAQTSLPGYYLVGKEYIKIMNLEPFTEYRFVMCIKTTAGVFSSSPLQITTRSYDDLGGLCVSFVDNCYNEETVMNLKSIVENFKSAWTESFSQHCTHLITNEPVGEKHTKAIKWKIPVVKKEWLEVCAKEDKIIPIEPYLLHSVAEAKSP